MTAREHYLAIAAKMLDCAVEEIDPTLVRNLDLINSLIQKCVDWPDREGLRSRQIIALIIAGWRHGDFCLTEVAGIATPAEAKPEKVE